MKCKHFVIENIFSVPLFDSAIVFVFAFWNG